MHTHNFRHTMLAALMVAAAPLDAHSQGEALAPGSYRCASYNVSGGGGSCRTMQPLVLHADQTYQFSSTRGRWQVRGGILVLSESTLWGPGQILGRDTVRFEYEYRGWRHTVTWICQACGAGDVAAAPTTDTAHAGSAVTTVPTHSAAATAALGGYRGVSLRLEFGSAIGGVSGFTIVPAESARSYTHNAPLPEGAVQGLAREVGPKSVALTTNASNKIRSGRQYVVFLAWPRETLPVATFGLPSGSADYSTTLAASLR